MIQKVFNPIKLNHILNRVLTSLREHYLQNYCHCNLISDLIFEEQ